MLDTPLLHESSCVRTLVQRVRSVMKETLGTFVVSTGAFRIGVQPGYERLCDRVAVFVAGHSCIEEDSNASRLYVRRLAPKYVAYLFPGQ